MLARGTLLHSRYRIVQPIGKGGMGTVYEAVDCVLQNTVAVKHTTLTEPDIERAFKNEARLLAALRHPALPVVTDYFLNDDGQFLVMQYIEGEDLAKLLEREGQPLAPDDVMAWAIALLDALTYLHEYDPPIVHRDIKPANVKRMPSGDIVLLDFGLAKGRAGDSARSAPDPVSMYGFTPKYAPLEQLDGRGTDARSDLYALGATLYHLSTQKAPPSALERSLAVQRGRTDPLTDAHVVNPRCSPTWGLALTRALSLDPGGRFQSAREMRSAIQGEGETRPATARPRESSVDTRRIDAAMPSVAGLGQPVDLIVQVRFSDSPLLGLEDWPGRRHPDAIEQGSEAVRLIYPTDSRTGALLPATIRIQIVAPEFTVEGPAARVIEVPPDAYSKRLCFLLTAQREGYCRVNVEVYGANSLYLGTIPVEAEAVAGAVAQPGVRVANLVLDVLARQLTSPMQSREFAKMLAEVMAQQNSFASPEETLDAGMALSLLPSGISSELAEAPTAVSLAASDDAPVVLIPRAGPPSDTSGWPIAEHLATPRLPASPLAPPPRGAGRRPWLVAAPLVVVIGLTAAVWHRWTGSERTSTVSAPMASVADSAGPPPAMSPSPPPPRPSPPPIRLPLEPEPAPIDAGANASAIEPRAMQREFDRQVRAAVPAAIIQKVAEYCASLDTLNPLRVRAVYPMVDLDALRAEFAQYASLQCVLIGSPRLVGSDMSTRTAQVEQRLQRRTMRHDGQVTTKQSIATIVLAAPDRGVDWRIVSIVER